jgi:hypothetical protein
MTPTEGGMQNWLAQDELGRSTGMVVPAYFSAAPTDELVRQLLWVTLADCDRYLPLENVWVVVDGDPRTERVLAGLSHGTAAAGDSSIHTLALEENRGKLGAIRAGVQALLNANPSISHIAIRDGDGDHPVSALPDLVRAARHIEASCGHTRVLVIGSRRSRHHPMGWVRGELETWLDSVTMDCLAYHLARQERALPLGFCHSAWPPDLSSGYKVYGRELARLLFVERAPEYACLSASDYWHFAPETAMVVEAVLTGATLGEVARLTLDGQPTSSFGEFRHVTLYGGLMAWVWARLDIPLPVAAQFCDNQGARLLLRTTEQGRDAARAVRQHALQALANYR